jgi:hypothetical protein
MIIKKSLSLDISWGEWRQTRRPDNLANFMCQLYRNTWQSQTPGALRVCPGLHKVSFTVDDCVELSFSCSCCYIQHVRPVLRHHEV